MNKMAKKLMAALLCLAMAVTLLPAIAVTSNAAAPEPTGILIFEEDFEKTENPAENGEKKLYFTPEAVYFRYHEQE